MAVRTNPSSPRMAGVPASDGSLVVDTRMRDKFGDVSRPEGLSSGPQEIALDDSGKPRKEAAVDGARLRVGSQGGRRRPQPPLRSAAPAAETKVATSAAPAPATGASDAESPFYKKMLSGIGDLFGTSPNPQPTTDTAQIAAPAAPMPPQRGIDAARPGTPTAPQKRAQAPGRSTSRPRSRIQISRSEKPASRRVFCWPKPVEAALEDPSRRRFDAQDDPGGTKKQMMAFVVGSSQRWKCLSGDILADPRAASLPSHRCQPSGISMAVSPFSSDKARQSLSLQHQAGYQS